MIRKITFTLVHGSGEVRDVKVNLAPEAEVEQAIARMRPVLLQGDDIHWGRVVSGIKLLAVNADDARSRIRMLEEAWKGFPPTYLTMFSSNRATGEEYTGSDRELAMDWIYAEFIHADASRAESIAPTSSEMRRHATTLFAKDAVQYVVATSRVIRELEEEGLVDFGLEPTSEQGQL
jgi:hypothetical protein